MLPLAVWDIVFKHKDIFPILFRCTKDQSGIPPLAAGDIIFKHKDIFQI